MIKTAILYTGSKGNATFVEIDGVGILIDCGGTYKKLSAALESINRTVDDINIILISHGHIDHVNALPRLLKIQLHHDVIPYLPYEAAESELLTNGQEITYGDRVTITPFNLAHDVPCFGFRIEDVNGNAYVHVADTGDIPCGSLKYLSGCHGITVEANHDLSLLDANRVYGDELKIRVSDYHFSNQQVSDLLYLIAHSGLEFVVLAHLSGMNNDEGLAVQAATHGIVDGVGDEEAEFIEVVVSEQDNGTGWKVIL